MSEIPDQVWVGKKPFLSRVVDAWKFKKRPEFETDRTVLDASGSTECPGFDRVLFNLGNFAYALTGVLTWEFGNEIDKYVGWPLVCTGLGTGAILLNFFTLVDGLLADKIYQKGMKCVDENPDNFLHLAKTQQYVEDRWVIKQEETKLRFLANIPPAIAFIGMIINGL